MPLLSYTAGQSEGKRERHADERESGARGLRPASTQTRHSELTELLAAFERKLKKNLEKVQPAGMVSAVTSHKNMCNTGLRFLTSLRPWAQFKCCHYQIL